MDLQDFQSKLVELLNHLRRLEEQKETSPQTKDVWTALAPEFLELLVRARRLDEARTETTSRRWLYLLERPHAWRRQLSIKGRNMTVGQLVKSMRADHLTPEQASEDFELPLAAIYEALAYYAENRALIELETCEERRRLTERGIPLEPQPVPR